MIAKSDLLKLLDGMKIVDKNGDVLFTINAEVKKEVSKWQQRKLDIMDIMERVDSSKSFSELESALDIYHSKIKDIGQKGAVDVLELIVSKIKKL